MKTFYVVSNEDCELFEEVLNQFNVEAEKVPAFVDGSTRYNFEVEEASQLLSIGFRFGMKTASVIFNKVY